LVQQMAIAVTLVLAVPVELSVAVVRGVGRLRVLRMG
jgi:hypothetical protein